MAPPGAAAVLAAWGALAAASRCGRNCTTTADCGGGAACGLCFAVSPHPGVCGAGCGAACAADAECLDTQCGRCVGGQCRAHAASACGGSCAADADCSAPGSHCGSCLGGGGLAPCDHTSDCMYGGCGWMNGSAWPMVTCSKGTCYHGRPDDRCEGKPNGYDLGDGGWCWDERRDEHCTPELGQCGASCGGACKAGSDCLESGCGVCGAAGQCAPAPRPCLAECGSSADCAPGCGECFTFGSPTRGRCGASCGDACDSSAQCLSTCNACVAGVCAAAPPPAPAPACNASAPAREVCDDFCNYRCSLYDPKAGETGRAQNVTMYRITPSNVTGIRNKNTGDPYGDAGFFLSRRNLSNQCEAYPNALGCGVWSVPQVYGKFVVETDGQWGPYLMCNPLGSGSADTPVQTQDFFCDQACTTPPNCGQSRQWAKNGTNWAGGMSCYCDRSDFTVGREPRTPYASSSSSPDWAPQCGLYRTSPHFSGYHDATCIAGDEPYRTVDIAGWNGEASLQLACEACTNDDDCVAWSTIDNRTATFYRGHYHFTNTTGCVSAYKHHSKNHLWYGATDIGGWWYSTPTGGECPKGSPLGTGGCTWRVVETVKYTNASCIDQKVDLAVERHGDKCFSSCPQPLNKTGDCYMDCYITQLIGDVARNVSKMTPDEIVSEWIHGFDEEDEDKGGCQRVEPLPCLGAQCPIE